MVDRNSNKLSVFIEQCTLMEEMQQLDDSSLLRNTRKTIATMLLPRW